ncbi:MAG: hypothetical protein ABDH21_02655 [bacterium]
MKTSKQLIITTLCILFLILTMIQQTQTENNTKIPLIIKDITLANQSSKNVESKNVRMFFFLSEEKVKIDVEIFYSNDKNNTKQRQSGSIILKPSEYYVIDHNQKKYKIFPNKASLQEIIDSYSIPEKSKKESLDKNQSSLSIQELEYNYNNSLIKAQKIRGYIKEENINLLLEIISAPINYILDEKHTDILLKYNTPLREITNHSLIQNNSQILPDSIILEYRFYGQNQYQKIVYQERLTGIKVVDYSDRYFTIPSSYQKQD